MKKKICLVGGFMINANYGDVIQAKVWIDWYRKNGYDFKFISYEDGKDTCINELELSNSEITTNDEFLKSNYYEKGYSVLHLYGGGYLNKLWGRDFVKLINKANNIGMNIVATGVQVDETYIKETKGVKIKYISVRDKLSKKMINDKESIILDDSLLYFRFKLKFSEIIRRFFYFGSKDVLLQLSLNSYVYKKEEKNKVKMMYRLIIEKLKKRYGLTMISSFPLKVVGILEGKKLINYLKVKNNITYSTTSEVEKGFYKKEFNLAIVNSFHTYIGVVNKFNCPIYFLALNQYYKQKALGLINYGLLDKKHLIVDLEKLVKIIDKNVFTRYKLNKIKLNNINNKSKKVVKLLEVYLK